MIHRYSVYFHDKNHFEDDDKQNYLVWQPVVRYLKDGNSHHVSAWNAKGFSGGSIKSPNSLARALNHINTKTQGPFDKLFKAK